jgi:PAS domain S-box-containing protein
MQTPDVPFSLKSFFNDEQHAERTLVLGVCAALLLLLVVASITFISTERLIKTSRWVSDSEALIDKIQDLEMAVNQAESGAQGFALTREGAYVRSGGTSVERIEQLFDDISQKTSSDPLLQKTLEAIRPLILERLAFMKMELNDTHNKGRSRDPGAIYAGKGEKLSGRLHILLQRMMDEERTQLQARRANADRTGERLLIVVILGSVLALTRLIGSSTITLRDLRNRRKIELRLRSLNALNRAIFDSADVSIISTDLHGLVAGFNMAAQRWFQYEATEVVGRFNIGDLVEKVLRSRLTNSDTSPTELDVLIDRAREGKSLTQESLYRRRDNTLFPVLLTVSPLFSETGELSGFLHVATDVTERRAAEGRLRESEERYRDLFEQAAELIHSTDADCRIQYVNPAWKTALGVETDDVSQLNVLNFIKKEKRQEFAEAVRLTSQGEAVGRVETVFSTPDGRNIEAAGYLSCRHHPSGAGVEIRAVLRDVTKAREVARLKDEFLSVVSHELRTPLTSIRGSLGLIAGTMASTLPEKGARMLQIALQNTDRLVRLINDMLDIERIQSGTVPMERRNTSSDEVMRQAVEVVQTLADKAGIELVVDFGSSKSLFVDTDRMIQAFTNLLGNAIKFSPPGSHVRFSAKTGVNEIVFTISDEGRGIPASKLDLIFERFQQVDASDSREKGGTGLGLPICRSIVHQHGGTIRVESSPGQGSTFSVSLPIENSGKSTETQQVVLCTRSSARETLLTAELQKNGFEVLSYRFAGDDSLKQMNPLPEAVVLDCASCDDKSVCRIDSVRSRSEKTNVPVVVLADAAQLPNCASLLKNSDTGQSDAGQPCILIVEDDLDLANVLVSTFEKDGVVTVHVSSGRGAIAFTQRRIPTLIILDVMIPEGDGFSVVSWLRSDENLRRVPLLVYSAKDLSPNEKQRLELQHTEFFTKARISPDEFEKQAASLLREIMAREGAVL